MKREMILMGEPESSKVDKFGYEIMWINGDGRT